MKGSRCNIGPFVNSRVGCRNEATQRVEVLFDRRISVSHMCYEHGLEAMADSNADRVSMSPLRQPA